MDTSRSSRGLSADLGLRGIFKASSTAPTKSCREDPGFTIRGHDSPLDAAGTFNWTMSPTMFLEASFGANFHHQEGCSITGGEPNYCRTGLSVTSAGNRNLSGFGNIPYLFPDATVLDPNTFSYWVLNRVDTTMWDGTRIVAPPQFVWAIVSPILRQTWAVGTTRRHRRAQHPIQGTGPGMRASESVSGNLKSGIYSHLSGVARARTATSLRHDNNIRSTLVRLCKRRLGVFSTYARRRVGGGRVSW